MSKTTTDLTTLTVKELHTVYLDTFGKPTKTRNKPWLIKKISAASQQPAADEPKPSKKRAAKKPAKAAKAAEPKHDDGEEGPALAKAVEALGIEVGTVITKTYKSRDLTLTIRAEGFEVEGTIYKSLSAAAKDIAGCNWNGHVFFGLKKRAVSAAAEDRA
jgi:hypothetical protein